jgi:cytochrome c oxidase subunit III
MHLPHGSWWPFWLACAITLLGLGIVFLGEDLGMTPDAQAQLDALYEKGLVADNVLHPQMPGPFSLTILGLGLLAVVGALLGWFAQDYRWWNEKLGTGTHIPKAGTLLFISSEIFLFGALFTNYFTFQHLSAQAGTGWPDVTTHLGLLTPGGIGKVAIFSLFLFASSGTVHMAEHHLKRGNHKAFNNWWLLTILLGAVFLVGQVLEYAELIREGHTLGSSDFMTAFFILTGTHGLHVFAGLCMLIVVQVRGRLGQFNEVRHAAPQAVSMYWHFVDIVWVFVFGIVYLMNLHA